MLLLGFLREWPLVAFVPAALFFALALRNQRPMVWGAALVWAAYAAYEFLMRTGVLCPDECNRVDLLVIDPFLLILSIVAVFSSMRGRRETDLT